MFAKVLFKINFVLKILSLQKTQFVLILVKRYLPKRSRMKKNIINIITLLSITSFSIAKECNKTCDTNCSQSTNLWQPRSFNAYSSRDILHKKTFYNNDSHRDEHQGMFSVAFEFMQSFGGQCGTCKNLGARPFWSGTNTMTYGTNDGNSDIDAYQFSKLTK